MKCNPPQHPGQSACARSMITPQERHKGGKSASSPARAIMPASFKREDERAGLCHKAPMPPSAPRPLFDRRQMRRNRARWEKDFAQHNALFAESAAGLLERLSWLKRDFARALDL